MLLCPSGFSRQEYWSRLPFPPLGDLPDPGREPRSLASPALAGRFFTTAPTRKPQVPDVQHYNSVSCTLQNDHYHESSYIRHHRVGPFHPFHSTSSPLLLCSLYLWVLFGLVLIPHINEIIKTYYSYKQNIYIHTNMLIHMVGMSWLHFSSDQFSRSVVSNSWWPHGLQHARLPCPSPTPGACSTSRPSSWWCHPTISSSVVPFSSCLQSFPASGSFPMSQFFPSGGHWSFSFSISPSNEYSGLISFRTDWFDLLVVQGTLKSLLQHHSSFRWVHKDSRISGLEYMTFQFYKTMKNSFAKGLSQITLPSAVDGRSYWSIFSHTFSAVKLLTSTAGCSYVSPK